MAHIIPFKAFLPTRDKVHLVASRSYISYTKRHLKQKLETNPFSYLHVINPDFLEDKPTRDFKSKYKKVREKFGEFVVKGFLYQDEKPNLYLYQQIKEGRVYSGVVAGISAADYKNNLIKIHEHTLPTREAMFKDYLSITRLNAEPVLIAHPFHQEIKNIKDYYRLKRPEFDFSTTNFVRHQFWKIEDEIHISHLVKLFSEMNEVYIADGHHRSASSVLLAEELGLDKKANKNSDFFMAMLIPENEIYIREYNRLVSSIEPYTPEGFLHALENNFFVTPTSHSILKPTKKHEFTMYFEGIWYYLTPKNLNYKELDPTSSLDPQILNELFFHPVLSVVDLKTDPRIAFMGGNDGPEGLKKAVDSGKMEVAFGVYPIQFEEVKKVADAKLIMPPKSTWVEPKLRSGLTVYEIY